MPTAQCFAVVMPSVSAAASTSNQVLPPVDARGHHGQADAVAGDRGAVGDRRAVIAAGDAQPMQLTLRRRRQGDDLADIGDYAGEHSTRS